MMRVQWNTEDRMEQILGQPSRMQPLPDNEIREPALGAIDRIRRMNDLSADLPVPEMFATVGKHPELLAAFLDFGVRFLGDTALEPRDRELAILRTGWLCGAPYEWGEHVIIGKEAGLTSEEIEWITIGSSAPGWGEHERAILKACEELHHDAMISDATWEVLSRRLDERQLIELPVLAGQYHKVAFIQNSLRFRIRECNPGLSAR
jgi:alkylhydroperoxidase family enzyme